MSAGRSLVGGALVALGAIYLLDAAGVIDAGGVVGRWWPCLFIALGFVQAFSEKRVSGVAIFLVVGGALLLAVSTGLLGETAWAVTWPILVVLAGAWLLSGWGRARRGAGHDPDFSRLSVFNSVRASQPGRGAAAGGAHRRLRQAAPRPHRGPPGPGRGAPVRHLGLRPHRRDRPGRLGGRGARPAHRRGVGRHRVPPRASARTAPASTCTCWR